MKQRINVSDLDQLTPAGKEKYFEWINRNCFYSGLNILAGEKPVSKRSKHLMNIGEMIEFLSKDSPNSYWLPGCTIGESEIDPQTWCNDLWSAVVELLNKE